MDKVKSFLEKIHNQDSKAGDPSCILPQTSTIRHEDKFLET